jgi:ferredoxin
LAEFLETDCGLDGIIPEKTLKTRPPQFRQERTIRPALPRYRNEISKYIILRDEEKCAACGRCVAICPQGVHVKEPGYKYFVLPKSHLCFGPKCEEKGCYCITACPQGALRIQENPMMKVLGDYRWPAAMILATWKMAERGEVPPADYDYEFETGNSGGGFDGKG